MSSYYYREVQWKSDIQESRMFGLINQGSTCYLNSVLQVLFRTRGFREAVNRGKTHNSAYIDPELQALFEDLSRRTAETVQVTNKLGIDRVNQQRDAAEYFEKILTLCSEEASQVFQGKLTNRTVCSECDDTIDEESEFLSLPLALVKSKRKHYSVVDGLLEFFKESQLVEDNQLYCEECSQKSDASTRCFITRHPEVLVLLLKRFEFNYSYMSYVKNDQVVDVPHTINIPENPIYEIYAFVEHFGSLRGGHYTATIKTEDRWFCFNDSSVTYLRDQPFQDHKSLESQSAYLLFYKRKSKEPPSLLSFLKNLVIFLLLLYLNFLAHAAGGGFPDNRGVPHDGHRNPTHVLGASVENNHDEEDELEMEGKTDTRSNERSRRPESGLIVEAGQNREIYAHQNESSCGYQDNQPEKMEGENWKSCNTAGSDQEEKSLHENIRKRRKVDVSEENAERVKVATEKPDDGLPASGNLHQIIKHSPEKLERESAKQNKDEKMETTEKTQRSHEKQEGWSVKGRDDQKMPRKRFSSQTKDPVENQRKKEREEKPGNDPSRKSSAVKQKTERNEDQNEIIEFSPHTHTEPETQSQEKVQKKTKYKRFSFSRMFSWIGKSKNSKEGKVSERVEEKSEAGNRSSSNGVENDTAARPAEKTKKQKKKSKPEQIPETTNEIKTPENVSENKSNKLTSWFSRKRKNKN